MTAKERLEGQHVKNLIIFHSSEKKDWLVRCIWAFVISPEEFPSWEWAIQIKQTAIGDKTEGAYYKFT